MSLTQAMEEAYAANAHGESVIETVTLDHVSFSAPLRLVTGVADDISLPLVSGGAAVLFKRVPLSITLPGVTEDGPTAMRLRIHDVEGVLTPYLEAAALSTGPITVVYRSYTTSDLTQPGDVIAGMEIRDIEQDPDGAEASVTLREIEMQAFPSETYDEARYPALQNN